MRADAVRNRQRIFDEARDAVAAGEIDLTLNELARRAGVGVGTVYRWFPTQRAMLEGVVQDGVRSLTSRAHRALEQPDGDEAFAAFLRDALTMAQERPGLFTVLISGTDETEQTLQAKAELADAVARLLDRVDPEPRPAPTMTAEYLLKLLCGLMHALSELPPDSRADATGVYVGMVMRGIQPQRR
ncbi:MULTISPECIES: TetR/AcrR family transcriptional regulator [Catenuloplanes]|uniref:AcrR family transcriptional regulator n=1 Tax=Catenuloplanes niger TaxID=587534 RepID=A0AAE3ZL45_9ACTN|nr:TetR/AcrR family transcriptional regulator [Catenuloplanes niger]MDR7319875.1 AcrR family transcriptional regulator [Catenuloplanes niger]